MVDGSAHAAVAPLFVPGNRPERFAKAAASGADAVIIDMEDAVPADAKAAARSGLAGGSLPQATVYVRVNAIGTTWHAEDIAAVCRLPLAGIVLPKAEMSDATGALASQLHGRMPLLLLIESAQGLSEARSLAALPGVVRLAFGSLDFCADLGIAHTRQALAPARIELAMASRLASLAAPIDGITADIADEALIEDDARHARDMGFGGKLAIHPKQIAPLIRGFMPTASEIDWARQVLAAGEDGAVAVSGMMIDAPVRMRARRILAMAEQHGPQ